MKKIFFLLFSLSFIFINQTFAWEWKEKEVANKDSTTSIYRTYYNNNRISQSVNGVSIEQTTKNSEWKIIEIKYLTKTKRLILNKDIWVARKTFSYNSKNPAVETKFFWLKSERKQDIKWCWWYLYALDKDTNTISSKTCLTTAENPTTISQYIKLDNNGVSSYDFISHNWVTEDGKSTKFDNVDFRWLDNKLVKDKNWFTGYSYVLIDAGNGKYSISIKYYNGSTNQVSTTPWINSENINSYTWNYRDWILVSRDAYGIDKLPIEDKDGYSSYTVISLPQDWWYKSIGISWQGKDRNKKNDSFGVSSYLFIYNSNDKLVDTRCQNSAGNTISCPNVTDTEIINKYQTKIWEKADFIKFPTYNSIFE